MKYEIISYLKKGAKSQKEWLESKIIFLTAEFSSSSSQKDRLIELIR